jgi:adenosylcobinamide-GDP ribazoletransferase
VTGYPGGRLGGLRLSVGTFTAVPVKVSRADPRTAGRAMLWSPVVGVGLAAVAAGIGWAVRLTGAYTLLAAVLALAVLAALTRGLHLDGLADTADGLGSGRPAEDALRIMKVPDVGPFGVTVLVLTLLVQAAALAQLWRVPATGAAALVVAAATGRLAAAWACRPGVPAARREGLGVLVAQTVGVRPLAVLTAAVLAGAGGIGLLVAASAGSPAPVGAAQAVLAATAGLLAAAALLRHTVARFGGVTGDVLGALVETATAVTLVVLALAVGGPG